MTYMTYYIRLIIHTLYEASYTCTHTYYIHTTYILTVHDTVHMSFECVHVLHSIMVIVLVVFVVVGLRIGYLCLNDH